MKSKKTVRSALGMSVLSIALCAAMLIGTTFAWFTDTATASVNTIQAGTLKVALEYATEWNEDGSVKTWTDAEGKTLNFKTADNRTTGILWEPGCTYELPELRIVNEGNLALKYKVVVSGAKDATPDNGKDDLILMDVIDWTYSVSGNGGNDTAELGTERHLAASTDETKEFDTLTISGHMQETAGNDYQGLSIDGIAITVVATQDTVEFDSTTKEYDKDAEYPVTISDIKEKYGVDGLKMPEGVVITDDKIEDGENGKTFTITLNDTEAFVYFTQVFDRAAAFEARKAQWGTEGFTKYPSEYNMADLNMWYGPYCSRITVKMGCDVDLNGMEVKPFGMSGYVFQFDGDGHTIKNAKVTATSGDAGFFMSRANVSNVVLDNIQVSALGCGSAGVVAGSPNSNITSVTVKNSSVTGAKYTGAIAGYDYGDITNCVVENTTVCGQYKVGGIVGYVCTDNAEQQRIITGNKLTDVTVKGDSFWSGKSNFVIGKIVGNWNAKNGTCKDNTFSGTTTATENIGEIESGCTAQQ